MFALAECLRASMGMNIKIFYNVLCFHELEKRFRGKFIWNQPGNSIQVELKMSSGVVEK